MKKMIAGRQCAHVVANPSLLPTECTDQALEAELPSLRDMAELMALNDGRLSGVGGKDIDVGSVLLVDGVVEVLLGVVVLDLCWGAHVT